MTMPAFSAIRGAFDKEGIQTMSDRNPKTRALSGVKALAFGAALGALIAGVAASDARAGSCGDGCMTLCNKTGSTVWIATLHRVGGMGCAFSGNGCASVTEGWWKLDPGTCFEPDSALFWETFYSIFREAADGSRIYPQWSKDQAVLDGSKYKGLSGYSGYSMCVDRHKAFRREVSGKPIKAFTATCPSGYEKSPVNLYTRAEAGYNLSYSIK